MFTTLHIKDEHNQHHSGWCHRSRKTPSAFSPGRIIIAATVFFLTTAIASVPPLMAQPLDRVIENLLDDDGVLGLCSNLIGAGASLSGELATFCSASTSGTPTSTGGGSSTPSTAPGIVQERMAPSKEDQDEAKTSTVSELSPGWSVFLSADGELLDRDVTTFEDGYDSSIWRATIGTDYQFAGNGIMGIALTTSSHEGDFESGGNFETDSYGFIAFGSFSPSENAFVQVMAGYSWKNYDRTRSSTVSFTDNTVISGSAKGEYDGQELSTGILFGYDLSFDGWTIGPRIGLDWIFNQFDEYTEQGNSGLELVFYESDETSFQSRVGFASSLAVNTGFGVLLPQFSADWVHEFADEQRNLAFSFADDDARVKFTFEDEEPDTDFFELAFGISAILPNGWLPYLQVRALVEHDFLDNYSGSIGLRKEL